MHYLFFFLNKKHEKLIIIYFYLYSIIIFDTLYNTLLFYIFIKTHIEIRNTFIPTLFYYLRYKIKSRII